MTNKTIIPNSPSVLTEVLCVDNLNKNKLEKKKIYIYIYCIYTHTHTHISHLLQAISPAVVPALAHIVNTSLHTGIFPSAFKQARITPLLKKPTLNPTLLGNYRPVSLLPFIAKHLNELCSTKSLPFSHRTTSWTVTNLASEVGIPPKLPCSQLLKT